MKFNVFQTVVSSQQYPQFLQDAMRVFIKVLHEVEPQFIAEQHSQQLRKLLLEIIHRIPTNEHLKPHVKNILALMFRLIQVSCVIDLYHSIYILVRLF